MSEEHNIRCSLIKHMRTLYNDGLISNQYIYNIHNNTITLLTEFLQENHNEIRDIEDINFNILRDFLKYLCNDRTQKQFLSIHRDVINMEFKVDIRARDLK